MHIATDELLHELAMIDATMVEVIRQAGTGCHPDLERQLDTHGRSLRVLLDSEGAGVAQDAIDAGKRVLQSAQPDAPLMMLDMARTTLSAVVRRQAARLTAKAA